MGLAEWTTVEWVKNDYVADLYIFDGVLHSWSTRGKDIQVRGTQWGKEKTSPSTTGQNNQRSLQGAKILLCISIAEV